MRKPILVGVAWPYVNGDIHIGHLAGYLFPADIFARFHRFLGNDVLMVSGSDCYGTPITIEADKRDLPPEKIVGEYHERDVALFKKLGISYDLYTKTATENHARVSQRLFLALLARGYIFKNTAEQYYSEAESRFLPDRYVEGTCPRCSYRGARSDQCPNCGAVFEQGMLVEPRSKTSGAPVILKASEHYFLDWPKLEPFLKKYLASHGQHWRKWVTRESAGWLKEGLKPRAITRDLDWGVPIPNDRIPENMRLKNPEHKRLYVWFEAVIGYLSASVEWAERGKTPEAWRKWWYTRRARHVYFMGKDNLVFHTLFWPGALHGQDPKIHLPDVVAVNQFLNLEGKAFSKSRGVIINAEDIIREYGVDPVRFYLTLIMPEEADANFSWHDFIEKNNSILIGNLGNFINRTLTLAEGEAAFREAPEREVVREVRAALKDARRTLEHTQFRKYLERVLALADFGNKYISRTEPWRLKKEDARAFRRVIQNSLYLALALQALLTPLLPETCAKMERLTGVKIGRWPTPRTLKKLLRKLKLSSPKPLFKKINKEQIALGDDRSLTR